MFVEVAHRLVPGLESIPEITPGKSRLIQSNQKASRIFLHEAFLTH